MTSYFEMYRRFTPTSPLKLGHSFKRSGNALSATERKLLSKYTGSKISELEANYLWPRIADHKWYLSERLSRDVGFHVAAVDYVENFYKPIRADWQEIRMAPYMKTIRRQAGKSLRFYFESKGQTPAL